MIGDWVRVSERDIVGNYQVQEIKYNGGYGVVVDQIYFYFMWGHHIQPIPLTEEILKANGFVFKNDEYAYLDLYGVIISFNNNTTLRIVDYRNAVDILSVSKKKWYVHELQHALRLCGLHELADNFKLE